MRRLYEFQCLDNHISEVYIDSSKKHTLCKECGMPSKRIVSAVRSKLDPISGDFPGATMKWAKMREQKIKIERKSDNHGDPDW